MAQARFSDLGTSRDGRLLANAENAKNKVINILIDYRFYTLEREKAEDEAWLRECIEKQEKARQDIIDLVQRLAKGERA